MTTEFYPEGCTAPDMGLLLEDYLSGKLAEDRAAAPRTAVIRHEIRRFLEVLFDGAAAPLVAHLAEMDAVSLDDLKELERHLAPASRKTAARKRRAGKEKP